MATIYWAPTMCQSIYGTLLQSYDPPEYAVLVQHLLHCPDPDPGLKATLALSIVLGQKSAD